MGGAEICSSPVASDASPAMKCFVSFTSASGSGATTWPGAEAEKTYHQKNLTRGQPGVGPVVAVLTFIGM